MAVNRGKQFEDIIKEGFLKVPDVSIDRLHDQTNGYLGSSNICDFIVYKKPYEYYIECKSVHGNTLSIHSNDQKKKYGNITNKQWEGLLEKSKIKGVFAGIICWWIDKDITRFIPIQILQCEKDGGMKSIRYDADLGIGYQDEYQFSPVIDLKGKKKRVFFDYDMDDFFHQIEKQNRR